MEGMSWVVDQDISGHRVHLAKEGRVTIIIAEFEDKILRLLPQETFDNDLPHEFCVSYIHWLDVESGEIEFRPANTPFKSLPENWRLRFSENSGSFLDKPGFSLVPPQQPRAKLITGLLNTLEGSEHVHILKDEFGTVHVNLPRLNLEFFVNDEGRLACQRLNAVVSVDQTIGCLHGLQQKLVLVSQFGPCRPRRSVLIPDGDLSIEKNGEHISVLIDTEKNDSGKYYEYELDQDLHRLKGQGDVLSTLHLAYLHGTTSGLLPDEFTGTTGTEEALRILCSSTLRLSRSFTTDEVHKLACIARVLSPLYTSTKHEGNEIPLVKWHATLSPLVQAEAFLRITILLKQKADRFARLYYEEPKIQDVVQPHNQRFQDRARARNAWIVASETESLGTDERYSARDCSDTDRGRRVHQIANLINRWPPKINVSQSIAEDMKKWGFVNGFGKKFMLESFQDLLTFRLAEQWGSLFTSSMSWTVEDKYDLMFLFCPISYREESDQDAESNDEEDHDKHESHQDFHSQIRTFLGVTFSGQLRGYQLPPAANFNLKIGSNAPESQLKDIIRSHIKSGVSDDDNQVNAQVGRLQQHFVGKWPKAELPLPGPRNYSLINLEEARKACQIIWTQAHQNFTFLRYIRKIQDILNSKVHKENEIGNGPEYASSAIVPVFSHSFKYPQLLDLLKTSRTFEVGDTPEGITSTLPAPCIQSERLEELAVHFTGNSDTLVQRYGKDLNTSLEALKEISNSTEPDVNSTTITLEQLQQHRDSVKDQLEVTFNILVKELSPRNENDRLLKLAGLWPSINPRALFSTFKASSWDIVSDNFRHALISYGSHLAVFQRAERLIRLAHQNDKSLFIDEISHCGQQNWSARGNREWLLIELENDITIRPEQVDIAEELLEPGSDKNTLTQLSMGKGKSSVIIPMLAVEIADTDALARILCLAQLREQTIRLLSQRLGGIVNRSIYHLPFSRKTIVNEKFLERLSDIHAEIIFQRGVLVALPEEILSFRLLLEEKVASKPKIGGAMMEIEERLKAKARDLIDESDEVLDPKFQLLYTIGVPQIVEGHPHRWTVAMEVLERLAHHAGILSEEFPADLKLFHKGDGSFPSMRFLKPDILKELMLMLLADIRENRVEGLSIQFAQPSFKNSLIEFITDRDIATAVADKVINSLEGTPHLLQTVLLLRGYISYEILPFVFQAKRWSVDYGLDLQRSMLAVPYKAKGVPHPSSEFGHTDIAILLTCLSYYYSGLTKEHLLECFKSLLRETNAAEEYARWCERCASLPDSLDSIHCINIDDRVVFLEDAFKSFRYNKGTIDFFLRKEVFPKYATEYTQRLCAAGWDLPSTNEERLTIGFSGTNDNRALLPLTIEQRDVATQQHTNAMVLDLLLREENQEYMQAVHEDGSAFSTEDLLKYVSSHRPPIHVLIDVGAIVLDMTNRDVAHFWLRQVSSAKGVVFFDETHEPIVMDRFGSCSPLFQSTLRREMNNILIFLDECHTRGIDLPIPFGARALVTLGPRLTKDRLSQGT
jgi:hypothetical protein